VNTGFPDFIQQAAQAAQNLAQAAQNAKLRIEFELSSDEGKNPCFKIGVFLKRYPELKNKEKEQLTPEDNQLLDSVEKILNDLLKRLKEIKGE
jgi:hypothetical protein